MVGLANTKDIAIIKHQEIVEKKQDIINQKGDKMTEKNLELEKIIFDAIWQTDDDHKIKGCKTCSKGIAQAILTYIRQEQVKLLRGLLKRAEHLGKSTFKYIRESDIQQAISRIEKER